MSSQSIRDTAKKEDFFKSVEKRECVHFRELSVNSDRCKCGLAKSDHTKLNESLRGIGEWSIEKSTRAFPTDAYGIIEFKGDPQHALKAKFARLSFDTDPRKIMRLFEEIWGVKRPKMVISVHGGLDDLKLNPKIARAFEKGLIKAAKTTGAWVITSGLNHGATPYVAKALASARKHAHGRNKIVSIGIAPWGLLKNASEFAAAGINSNIRYHPRAHASDKFGTLNDQHGYFLLADNGTCARYGAEVILRRRFEEYLSQQFMATANKEIPVVSVILGGGMGTIRTVLDYLTSTPPIPVVACEGSGGAAELLAQVNRHMSITQTDQPYKHEFMTQLKANIQYHFASKEAKTVIPVCNLIKFCGYRHKCITGYRLNEDGQSDIDHSILTALLTREGLTFADRLGLVLAWKRVDIARSDVFVKGDTWTPNELDNAMMEALVLDRPDFVDLLLQNGCLMEKFLTKKRLEELYNTSRGPPTSLLHFVIKNVARRKGTDPYTLKDVGRLVEKMIGGSYKSPYLSPAFNAVTIFDCPFNELLIWAVLCNRKEMALRFWHHGEDALAKALVAAKLYKECAEEIAEFDPDQEEVLSEHAREFERLSVDLLGHCYLTDDDRTFELLTYELRGWPGQTCLGLAVLAGNKPFLAHGACQILLTDLWCGGMRIHKCALLYTLFAVMLPCFAFCFIDFKTKGELRRQAQKGIEQKDEQKKGRDQKQSAERVQLSCRKKVKEFLGAPITTFWCWTISYIVFVTVFCYAALVETKPEPSWEEYFMVAYAVTYGLEICRQVLISEERTCLEKLAEFARDGWKVGKILAILWLVAGFVLRHWPEHVPRAHVIYALDCGFWIFRLLEISEVISILGQYLSIISKMVNDTMYIVSIMVVMLFTFGVMRTSILHPYHKKWEWEILRNVTYKAYFMWYGEVFASDIDNCVETGKGECLPGNWLAASACAVYMMLTNIILLNLLIAMFNHIYEKASAISTQVWKFKRYYHVMEYEQHPALPPPFVILYHIYAIFMFFIRCIFKKCCRFPPADYALKLVLNDKDVEKLLDFEEECMEDFIVHKKATQHYSQNERLKRITDRQEFLLLKIDEILAGQETTVASLNELSQKIKKMDREVRGAPGGQSSLSIDNDMTPPSLGGGQRSSFSQRSGGTR